MVILTGSSKQFFFYVGARTILLLPLSLDSKGKWHWADKRGSVPYGGTVYTGEPAASSLWRKVKENLMKKKKIVAKKI